jgi:hypothetical protein
MFRGAPGKRLRFQRAPSFGLGGAGDTRLPFPCRRRSTSAADEPKARSRNPSAAERLEPRRRKLLRELAATKGIGVPTVDSGSHQGVGQTAERLRGRRQAGAGQHVPAPSDERLERRALGTERLGCRSRIT